MECLSIYLFFCFLILSDPITDLPQIFNILEIYEHLITHVFHNVKSFSIAQLLWLAASISNFNWRNWLSLEVAGTERDPYPTPAPCPPPPEYKCMFLSIGCPASDPCLLAYLWPYACLPSMSYYLTQRPPVLSLFYLLPPLSPAFYLLASFLLCWPCPTSFVP